MTEVKKGKKVSLHYTGRVKNGEEFDSSIDKDPFTLTIGEHKTIPGFEEGIIGLKEGETKTFTVFPKDGFGQYCDSLVGSVERESFKEAELPSVGDRLQLVANNDQVVSAKVIDIQDDSVRVDANHPLAGKTLEFDVEIIRVLDESAST